MCSADDALPPRPPVRGGAADSAALALTSGDGARLGAVSPVPPLRSPLLMPSAGADLTPSEAQQRFSEQLPAAGVEVERHTYPGAACGGSREGPGGRPFAGRPPERRGL